MFPEKYERSFTLICLTFIALVEYSVIPVLNPIGFYCRDPKLSHKFYGDTVSIKWLLSTLAVVPLAAIFLTAWRTEKCSRNGKTWKEKAWRWYRDYLSGLLLTFTAVVLGKIAVGEPRPHFLDTCRPKEAENCSSQLQYFPKFRCYNTDVSPQRLQDASKSFPSGHAAFSLYMFVFLTYFLRKRLRKFGPAVYSFLSLCLVWAILCSLTRITDRRHHWWDVMAGSIVGSIVGYFAGSHSQNITPLDTDNQ